LYLGEHFDADLPAITSKGAKQSASASVREWRWVRHSYEAIPSGKTDDSPANSRAGRFEYDGRDFVRRRRVFFVTDADNRYVTYVNAITLGKRDLTFEARAVQQRAIRAA
jgi:hypothetical protein